MGCIALGDFFRKGPYDLGQACFADHHFLVAGTYNGQVSVHGLVMGDYLHGFYPLREDVTLQAAGGDATNVTVFDDLIVVAVRTTNVTMYKMSQPPPENADSKLPVVITHRVISPPSFLSSVSCYHIKLLYCLGTS